MNTGYFFDGMIGEYFKYYPYEKSIDQLDFDCDDFYHSDNEKWNCDRGSYFHEDMDSC